MQDSVKTLEIDHNAVRRVAREVRAIAHQRAQPLEEESWSDPRFWNVTDSRRDRCQYLALGNAINFRFWSLCDQTVIPCDRCRSPASIHGAPCTCGATAVGRAARGIDPRC